MENSDSQPKLRGTKKKSLSKQIDFFYCSSSIKNLSQKTPWPFQNPRENTVVIDSFTIDFFPNTWKQNKMYIYQIEL